MVRAYLNGEGGYRALAAKHDISNALLMVWVEKYRAGELSEEKDNDENVREYEARIAALERKAGQLVMELDLVKKQSQRRTKASRSRSSSGRRVYRARRMPHDGAANQHVLQGAGYRAGKGVRPIRCRLASGN